MKRLGGVTIISYLPLLQGVVGILFGGAFAAVGILALANHLPTQELASLDATSASDWALVGAYTIITLLVFAGGVALLSMHTRGWAVAMLLQGYTLALNL
jgi:hypothetical protein